MKNRAWLWGGWLLAIHFLCPSRALARDLTFEDRVRAQTAIERVYWSHRIWPRENAGLKPPLEQVMPESAIRAKVEDYLEKSNALEAYWRRPVTGAQLQAEMVRMSTHTHDGKVLSELFAALGNDPRLIAETLARPILVDRSIRSWYARDSRFHAQVRRRAEADLAGSPSVAQLRSTGVASFRAVWRTGSAGESRRSGIWVPLDEWRALDARLESQPTGVVGTLQEEEDAFTAIAAIARSTDELTTLTFRWRKVPFDTWWKAHRGAWRISVLPLDTEFRFVPPSSQTCVNDTWSPVRSGVPDARTHHTAVWTGSEMIVWGGERSTSQFLTGGRYDPATDSWTATRAGSDAPAARRFHKAVWTGTEMLVWGGQVHNTYSNTGGLYDPQTDTWRATSVSGAPTRRVGHTLIWTGTEAIVWAGEETTTSTHTTRSGGRYNPVTDSWTATSGTNAPRGREEHTAVWTGSRMIVWGGSDELAHWGSGGIYDPSTDTWQLIPATTDAPVSRTDHVAVWTGTEMVVWGGDVSSGGIGISGGRYNPASNTWRTTSMTGAPAARNRFTAVWTDSEMIVWGGNSGGVSNTGGRYDPVTDSWLPTGTGPNVVPPREWHTAVWTGSEMIVWGGDAAFRAMETGGRYTPATDSWVPTSLGTVPAAREGHLAVWTGSEMIVWGGSGEGGYEDFVLGSRYDPVLDDWSATSTSSAPIGRSGATGVWTGTEMIVWGGELNDFTLVGSGGRYNPATDRWTPTSTGESAPVARRYHTAIWSGREMIVWGGDTGGEVNGNHAERTGGRYDPRSDSWVPTRADASAPAAREAHVAAYVDGRMLVWGGDPGNFVPMTTGGRYDPSTDTWTPTRVEGGVPSPLYGETVVATPGGMIVWGGHTTSTAPVNKGWRYDLASDTWAPTSTAGNVPPARILHTAVWTGAEMIVWGGRDGHADELNSGGRYDPSTDTWTPTSQGAHVPHARRDHTSVWTGQEMIVWGGNEPLTATGGRYCACPNGALAYRDADGDGFGDASASVPSCDGTAPKGYVLDPGDCDDASATAHPGAAESCNGADDDCNGTIDDDGTRLCDDGNPCTTDSCAAEEGCVNAPVPKIVCNDHNACTQDYCDPDAGCMHAPVLCRDGDPQTVDSCDPRRGCVFTPRHGAPASFPAMNPDGPDRE